MQMRFTIEQRVLTDESGKPVAGAVSFHNYEAASADDAIQLFLSDHRGEIVGNIVTFPGFHAVATVRNTAGVSTLQVSPASANLTPLA